MVLADKKVPTHVYDGAFGYGEPAGWRRRIWESEAAGVHRAKEEFESAEGKEILKALGIEGDYEGIGHCILGYPAAEPKEAAARKDSYIYYAR